VNRRKFLACFAAAAISTGRAGAQQPATLHRVGVLASTPPMPDYLFATLFREALAELGWIEGANLVLDWRHTDGKAELFAERAAELVAAKPDVIVATTPAAVIAAKHATRSIAIVMVNTSDPVQLSIVESIGRPGGNITGTSSLSADVSLKQLELLTQLLPGATRVAVLSTVDNPWHPIAIAGLETGARGLGLELMVVKLAASEELEGAFARIAAGRVQAVLVLADPMTFVHRRRVTELAARHRLPAVYGLREYAEAGGLMSYWADSAVLYRRTAAFVDKILKGAKPADLPIEQPTRFELILNMRAARDLGLLVPPTFLARADEVIE
jgi:putative tryptophan/tyrosine transport system substrate-binding protein